MSLATRILRLVHGKRLNIRMKYCRTNCNWAIIKNKLIPMSKERCVSHPIFCFLPRKHLRQFSEYTRLGEDWDDVEGSSFQLHQCNCVKFRLFTTEFWTEHKGEIYKAVMRKWPVMHASLYLLDGKKKSIVHLGTVRHSGKRPCVLLLRV